MTVTLRERLKGKKISLYLEYYENGKKTYEYPRIHLLAGSSLTAAQQKENDEKRKFAENVLALRKSEILRGKYGLVDSKRLKGSFIKYFEALADNRKENNNNYQNWISTLRHLKSFCKDISFADVNKRWIEDFRNYLQHEATKPNGEPLKPNSQSSYFNKLKAALKQAYKDDILLLNIAEKIAPIKGEQNEMCYLTEEETQKMVDAECESPVLKRAFLFSCVTGLRYSDVEKLTWSELHSSEGGYNIHFRQQKVKEKFIIQPLKNDFVHLLSKQGKPNERVFEGLYYGLTRSKKFDNWVANAGINKSPTFHSARHTFATILLNKGESIYVVSKLLGHKSVSVTERVYAHLILKTKQETANRIDLKFKTA